MAAVPAEPVTGPVAEVKSVHSPGKVTIVENLAPGQCKVRTVDAAAGLFLPDPSCTPGASDPAVTQDNIGSTICKAGYMTKVRHRSQTPTGPRR